MTGVGTVLEYMSNPTHDAVGEIEMGEPGKAFVPKVDSHELMVWPLPEHSI